MNNTPLREYKPVTFADDENIVVVGAETFKAIDGKPGKCDGCEMKDGFSCSLWRVHTGSPRCQPQFRKDQRSVVWVFATTKEKS